MENEKCLFSEIPINGEFTIHKPSTTTLIKVSDTHYCIKGQTRQWRANKSKEYFKK